MFLFILLLYTITTTITNEGDDRDSDIVDETAVHISASSSKLEHNVTITKESRPTESSNLEGYRFVDIQALISLIQLLLCRACSSITKSGSRSCATAISPDYSVTEKKCGLSSKIVFHCNHCTDELLFETSPNQNINMWFQLAMYSVGINKDKSKRFLANMNMPPPISAAQSCKYRTRILHATESTAKERMLSAGNEVKQNMNTNEITTPCEGTWQRSGFVSKNGIATVLSVNPHKASKVIDVEVMSNYCDACSKAKKRLLAEKLLEWRKDHKNCQRNHDGPPGQMEPSGMLAIFHRSVNNNGLKYVNYLEDGDSKSFKSVAEATPPVYDGIEIKKLLRTYTEEDE